jgi:aryl-alcohol dehydrogenase
MRGIVEGDNVPTVFLPRLIDPWRQGRFPVERVMTFYDFDQIERTARDAEAGEVIKPVLRAGSEPRRSR